MRVAYVAHNCVVGLNQQLLVELSRRPQLDLSLVAPARWTQREYGTRIELDREWGRGRYEVVAGHVTPDYKGVGHVYCTGLLGHLLRRRPQIIEVVAEPYSLVAFQVARCARLLRSKLVVAPWQNLYRELPIGLRQIERWVLAGTDYILAGNADALGVVRRKGYRGPGRVIGQGYNPRIRRADPTSLRRSLALSGFTVGFAGRLVAQKGVDLLLRAIAALPPDTHGLIVGDGPERSALEDLAAELRIVDRVRFTGALPRHEDVPRYMAAMDVFVLPSITTPKIKEQFGLVLVEAMVCGVAVVGSSSGEIPRIIGDAGLVFPEGDAVALAQQLQRLRDTGQREELARCGRRRAVAEFSWPAVADKTFAAYRELMGHSDAGAGRSPDGSPS
jgi:glycosyltransferase involved in cell wall biosynthesis